MVLVYALHTYNIRSLEVSREHNSAITDTGTNIDSQVYKEQNNLIYRLILILHIIFTRDRYIRLLEQYYIITNCNTHSSFNTI